MWIDWRTKEKPLPICGRGHHDVICYLRIESAQSDWIGVCGYLGAWRKNDGKPIRGAQRRVGDRNACLGTTGVSITSCVYDLRVGRVCIRGRINGVTGRRSPAPSLRYGFGVIDIAGVLSGTVSVATHALQRKAKDDDDAAGAQVVQGQRRGGHHGRGAHRRCGCGSRGGGGTGRDVNVQECGTRGYVVRAIEHQRRIQSDVGYLNVCNHQGLVSFSVDDRVIEVPLVSSCVGCLDGVLGGAAHWDKLIQRLLSDGWVCILRVNREDHSGDCRECNAELSVVLHNTFVGFVCYYYCGLSPSITPLFKKKRKIVIVLK